MTLDQVLADALNTTTAAGGHPEPFKNDKGKTTQVLQALVVYTGLQEIAQNMIDITSIGDSLTTMIDLLGTIQTALLAGQTVDLQPLLDELAMLRDAIHRR